MLCQFTESHQFTIINVSHVLFGIKESIEPVTSTFRQYNRTITIQIEPFLINPTDLLPVD